MTDHPRFHRSLLITALVSVLLVATPAGLAQDWQGQDSEFGSIRAPYTATMDGSRVPIEARIILRENYEDKDSRFFMFAFTVENTPLDVKFDHLVRMDTNEELPCYQREGSTTSALKCFVDLKDMPPPGVEIRMDGSVGGSRAGMFQVGAIVVPFTYTWMRVQMSNHLNAELYAGTQLNVLKPTSGGGRLGGEGNGAFAKVPDVGLLGVVGVGVTAAVLLAARRKP